MKKTIDILLDQASKAFEDNAPCENPFQIDMGLFMDLMYDDALDAKDISTAVREICAIIERLGLSDSKKLLTLAHQVSVANIHSLGAAGNMFGGPNI